MASGQGEPDELARRLLKDPTATDARAWLTLADGVTRTLAISDSPSLSLGFVEDLYRAGALRVIATKIEKYEREDLEGVARHESTRHMVIELPHDPKARKRVFRIHGKISKGLGFDPTNDEGQQYLYCMLD